LNESQHLKNPDHRTRPPLKPIAEGWRRFAILGSIAIGVAGVLAAIAALEVMVWWITTAR
jgi:hypothetical protein